MPGGAGPARTASKHCTARPCCPSATAPMPRRYRRLATAKRLAVSLTTAAAGWGKPAVAEEEEAAAELASESSSPPRTYMEVGEVA